MRADAHLHFFRPGYVALVPDSCRRQVPDEVTLYAALAQQHAIEQVLAVGYEGQAWAAGNNAYLAELAGEHTWIRPAAFVEDPAQLSIEGLEKLAAKKFVGLSVYVFDDVIEGALAHVDAAVWAWLEKRRWLISVNSKGARWAAFVKILERYPNLRLLVSHLGLPPATEGAMTQGSVHQGLESVMALAGFPGVCVKLSGFYALTVPGYDYPHRNAWPYVVALLESFGVHRLLWGSDFSPSLELVSFPQTLGLLAQMPFLTDKDRAQIEGVNLLRILGEV
jgi:L-fuconolactonase